MIDSYKHKGQRKKLIKELRSKGISDEKVLEAMERVPRHFFMESGFEQFAYKDQAFPISKGQTISQPYTVAYQTELLTPRKHEKILEIGTGSGYQTAILLEMGAKVYSIERYRELYLRAKSLLNEMGYQPYLFYGDGYKGQPTYAPYDKILVTAGASDVPRELLDQLQNGGKMVIPVGDQFGQQMMVIEKTEQGDTEKHNRGSFIFVPLIPGKDTNNQNP
ncbi:MAG: protein-L-isoaspartate(D-aspartate) O-methyltransferase [Bacteroidales bacterium]|nr:protein-L-isoaspartate(D-aspartate) O-methyltransferase [Bacteroidales bacterium]